MWAGVIFSPTKKSGDEFRKAMGLKYWHVTTPDSLLHGRSRGVICEPRMFALSDPGHEPMSTAILQYSNYLVTLCDGRMPTVYHVRKAGT